MRSVDMERLLDWIDTKPSQRGQLWRMLTDYETLIYGLWTCRVHELNADGSPCWCPTENEPVAHSETCTIIRETLLRLRENQEGAA